MNPTQQELYTHIKKHSGLMYSELFEDIGHPQGLGALEMIDEIEFLIKKGLVKRDEFRHMPPVVRAA